MKVFFVFVLMFLSACADKDLVWLPPEVIGTQQPNGSCSTCGLSRKTTILKVDKDNKNNIKITTIGE